MNNKGFTLLSSLLAISLSAITILLIISLSNLIIKSDFYDKEHQRSVYIFMSQIGREIHEGSNFICGPGSLTFTDQGNSLFYHQSGDRLIREVNQSGYDIALQNLTTVQFHCPGPNVVNIDINPGWHRSIAWSEASFTGGTYVP